MQNQFIWELIQNYGITAIISFCFIAFIRIDRHFGRNIARWFIGAAVSVILLTAADAVQSYCESLSYPTALRMFAAASAYSLRVIVLYCILRMFSRDRSARFQLVLTIPMIVNTLASFSAFLWKAAFYYTEDNQLIRGPVIIIPFLVSLLYFGIMVFLGRSQEQNEKHRESVFTFLIFIFCAAATVLELKLRIQGILPLSCICGTIFYYMHFLSASLSRDSLTGAYIRSRLFQDTADDQKQYGVISMDLNDLKQINDTLGHLAGDQALKSVTQAAFSCMPPEASLYRFGGDEFVIVYYTEDGDRFEMIARQIACAVENSAATGYTVHIPGESFKEALERADRMMYLNKAQLKENRCPSV